MFGWGIFSSRWLDTITLLCKVSGIMNEYKWSKKTKQIFIEICHNNSPQQFQIEINVTCELQLLPFILLKILCMSWWHNDVFVSAYVFVLVVDILYAFRLGLLYFIFEEYWDAHKLLFFLYTEWSVIVFRLSMCLVSSQNTPLQRLVEASCSKSHNVRVLSCVQNLQTVPVMPFIMNIWWEMLMDKC